MSAVSKAKLRGSFCWASLLLGSVFITACSFKSPERLLAEAPSSWFSHLAVLASLDTWSFNGRVAVRQANESWSVGLRWAQSSDHYDIHLTAPFGQGAAHLYGDGQQATIVLPNQAPQVAVSAQALLQRQVGWSVPVDDMRYWLLGRPGPTAVAVMAWDEQGRLVQLEQAGWLIKYRRYKDINGLALPSKIELLNDDLRVRLLVDGWQL